MKNRLRELRAHHAERLANASGVDAISHEKTVVNRAKHLEIEVPQHHGSRPGV